MFVRIWQVDLTDRVNCYRLFRASSVKSSRTLRPRTQITNHFSNMPTDEKSRKHHDESDSEEEEEVETFPKVDIDVSKLTPLSPEVISKQVSPGSLFAFRSLS